MGSNFVNIGTDILQAYLGGKQIALQKQKQAQEAEQFQQRREDEANELKERVKMHQDSLKNAMEIHTATQKAADAKAKVQNAIQKARIKTDLIQGFNQEGGFPQEDQLPETGPTVGNLTAPLVRRNAAQYSPFSDIPELSDISIRGNEVAAIPRMDRIAQENAKARAAAQEDQQASRMEQARLLEEGRKDRADDANKTRLMIATMMSGGQSGTGPNQIDPQSKGVIDDQFLTGDLNMDDFNKLHSITKGERQIELGRMLKEGGRPLLKKETETLDALTGAKKLFQQMIDFGKVAGVQANIPFTDQYSALSEIESGIGKLRDVLGGKGLGVLSENDLRRLTKAIPSWKDSKAGRDEKIRNLRAIQNDAFERLLKKVPPAQRQKLLERWGPDILLEGSSTGNTKKGLPEGFVER